MEEIGIWLCVALACLTFGVVGLLAGGGLADAHWRNNTNEPQAYWLKHCGRQEYVIMPAPVFYGDYVYKGYVVAGLYCPSDDDMARWGTPRPERKAAA